jgi:hypothetical protein
MALPATGERARSIRLLACYPRWWRARYGAEMEALLGDRRVGFRDAVDVLRGALDAHLRGEADRPGAGALPALAAGAAWTVAGAATLAQPAPPDWPGLTVETLPLALVGAVAVTLGAIGVARRGWIHATAAVEVALIAVVLGGVIWALALAMAVVGGPYGAITGAAQAVAAIAGVGLGLAIARSAPGPLGLALAVASAAMLVPSPAAWLVTGATWTGIGLLGLIADRASTLTPGAS